MAPCRDCKKETNHNTICAKPACYTRFPQCAECFGLGNPANHCDAHRSPIDGLKRKLAEVEKELDAKKAKTSGTGPEPKDGQFWATEYYCTNCKHINWAKYDTYADAIEKRLVCRYSKCSREIGLPSIVQVAICSGDIDGEKSIVLSIRAPVFASVPKMTL